MPKQSSYKLYLEQKRCPHCSSFDRIPGSTSCLPCTLDQRKVSQTYYTRHRQAVLDKANKRYLVLKQSGLCISCGRPRDEGSTALRCDACAASQSDRDRGIVTPSYVHKTLHIDLRRITA